MMPLRPMLVSACLLNLAQAAPLPTSDSDWKGFTKQAFDFEGKKAFVVQPKSSAPGRPWIWRTSFPDFHAEVDLELLQAGFHVAHVDVVSLLGNDESLEIMDRFYDQVREQWSLAPRPALEAVSRGGLHAYRYAATRPARVSCIYADTPVMDLKSWPLKHAKSKGALEDAFKHYGFADEAALRAYHGGPLDLLETIALAKIPLRHIVSSNDLVVPIEENTLEAQRRLQALGWDIDLVWVDPATTINEGHHFPLVGIEETVAFVQAHAAAPLPLFDGKSFSGWEGDIDTVWRIEEGALVAGSLEQRQEKNNFLATTKSYGDFELTLKWRLQGSEGFVNGGVQFRSQRIPNHHEVIGYQADLGAGCDGALYDESRRKKMLARPSPEVLAKAQRPLGEWNDYRIRAEGPRIRIWLNGIQTVDYVEEDDTIEQSGLIAVQIHGNATALVQYRDLGLVELGTP